jgi:hypothetical protein
VEAWKTCLPRKSLSLHCPNVMLYTINLTTDESARHSG